MVTPNPIIGTGLHSLGGMSAAMCYLPFQKTRKWSWGSFWLLQALFAWIIIPLLLGVLTVPGFFSILFNAPANVFLIAFLLGAFYGFGGMSFGFAIGHIGYSLTYTIAIGISAVLGTLFPLMLKGGLVEYFSRPGGNIVLLGMTVAIFGVGLCGWAGFQKEKELNELGAGASGFNMLKGLILSVIAGMLSAVFNVSLEHAQPISDLAAANGAGHFEGNAKLIVTTSGCFVTNLIWFVILGIRQNTLKEFTVKSGIESKIIAKNYLFSALAGILWCTQFFFYGLGHVKMGDFQFASWVLHMSMLIFFSYIAGMIMKEWKIVSKKTFLTLIIALISLVISFMIMTYGSMLGA